MNAVPAAEKYLPLEIDKRKTALAVVDLQRGIDSFPALLDDSRAAIDNTTRLTDAFRRKGTPVFLVHVVASCG